MTYLDTVDPTKLAAALDKARERGFRAPGGRDMLETAGGDERYALWLLMADAKMGRLVGVGIFDLADYEWAYSYRAGDTPTMACREALANDDTFAALVGGI